MSKLTHYAEEIVGNIRVDFDTTDQILVIYSAFVKYVRKNWNKIKQFFGYLWTPIRRMIQLGGKSFIIFSQSLGSP